MKRTVLASSVLLVVVLALAAGGVYDSRVSARQTSRASRHRARRADHGPVAAHRHHARGRRHGPPLHRRAGGPHPRLQERRAAGDSVPRHLFARQSVAASAACSASPSRTTTRRRTTSTSTTPTRSATPSSRATSGARPTPTRQTPRANRSSSPSSSPSPTTTAGTSPSARATASSTSASATAAAGATPTTARRTRNELLGKMLRLDVETGRPFRYTVPPDNPFVSRAGFRPEIWALGPA